MKLANFFDRSALAVAQVIQNMDASWFRDRMKKLAAGLAFDRAAASASEGIASLHLAMDLLARFYPGICVMELDRDPLTQDVAQQLKAAAKAIHPAIDLAVKPHKIAFCLVVGDSYASVDVPTIFVGSEGWTATVQPHQPVGSIDTQNPFGAAAAACIGVANGFRIAFADELSDAPPDQALEFDVLHHRLGQSPAELRVCPETSLGPA